MNKIKKLNENILWSVNKVFCCWLIVYSRVGERLGERLCERGDLVKVSSDIGFVKPTDNGPPGALIFVSRLEIGERWERTVDGLVDWSGIKRTWLLSGVSRVISVVNNDVGIWPRSTKRMFFFSSFDIKYNEDKFYLLVDD